MKAQKYQMEMQDTQPSAELKKAIENFEAIVYADGDTSILDDPSKWEMGKNVFEVKILKGDNDTFYYVHLEIKTLLNAAHENVVSFREHHEKI